jgi:uncharacterized glyoxalase superfamily protein PhnB
MPKTVIPTLRYADADAAIAFLERAFGFERGDVHRGGDGQVHHAELRFGDGWVMLGTARDDGAELSTSPGAATAYVVADDVDALHDRAVAAGAEVVRPLADTDYGSRDFAARDPEGNVWSFGTYGPRMPAAQDGPGRDAAAPGA